MDLGAAAVSWEDEECFCYAGLPVFIISLDLPIQCDNEAGQKCVSLFQPIEQTGKEMGKTLYNTLYCWTYLYGKGKEQPKSLWCTHRVYTQWTTYSYTEKLAPSWSGFVSNQHDWMNWLWLKKAMSLVNSLLYGSRFNLCVHLYKVNAEHTGEDRS